MPVDAKRNGPQQGSALRDAREIFKVKPLKATSAHVRRRSFRASFESQVLLKQES